MTRRTVWLLAAVAGAALLLAGCSRADAAKGDAVTATQARLGKIRATGLDLRLTASAERTSGPAARPVGFDLRGHLALPEDDGGLPVADLSVTRLLGSSSDEARFVSTGKRAWVGHGGTWTELRGSQLDSLRGTRSGEDLGGLHLAKWFDSTRVATSGADTTVTGKLDVVDALDDVFRLAGSFGAGDHSALDGKDADHLRGLVRSSQIRLVTTTGDHVLRTLRWDVAFAPGNDAPLRRALGDLGGAGLSFELRLSDVDRPVRVAPPVP